jgi:hypothetical protein
MAQLGMPFGTASGRLRKIVLFDLLSRHAENICYQCHLPIETVDELSLEHKIPWLGNDTSLFWDLGNIGFSHFTCNVAAKRGSPDGAARGGVTRRKKGPPGTFWCAACRSYRDACHFTKDSHRWSGLSAVCRDCRPARRPSLTILP